MHPDANLLPSIEDVKQLTEHSMHFLNQDRYGGPTKANEENKRLPHWTAIADLLARMLPQLSDARGWPQRTLIEIREIARCYAEVGVAIRWESVSVPEPARSEFLAQRRTEYQETVIRPLHEAAISWVANWDLSHYRRCDSRQGEYSHVYAFASECADEARGVIFARSVSFAEGESLFKSAWTRWNDTPQIGSAELGEVALEAKQSWARAMGYLHDMLRELGNLLPPRRVGSFALADQPESLGVTTPRPTSDIPDRNEDAAKRELPVEPSAMENPTPDSECPAPPDGDLSTGKLSPTTLADLAKILRRDRNRARTQIALLEHMHAQDYTTFDEIRDKVHGSKVDDSAIERNLAKTRSVIGAYGVKVRLVQSGFTISRIDPDHPSLETSPETTPKRHP